MTSLRSPRSSRPQGPQGGNQVTLDQGVLLTLLLNARPEAIFHLCQNDPTFLRVCGQDELWTALIKRDYEGLEPDIEGTPREIYQSFHRAGYRHIPLVYSGDEIEKIWIQRGNTAEDILNVALRYFEEIYGDATGHTIRITFADNLGDNPTMTIEEDGRPQLSNIDTPENSFEDRHDNIRQIEVSKQAIKG